MGWKCVVTNAGNEALGVLAGGQHTLTITGATTGSGTTPEINMRIATELAEEKMDAQIVSRNDVSNGVTIRVRTGPASAAVGGFVAHEEGIWARMDSGDPFLMVLAQDAEGGISVPTAAENPEFVFDLFITIASSNTDDLSVTIDTNVYVTYGEFSEVAELIGDTALPTTSQTITGAIAEIFADAGKPIMPSEPIAIPASGTSVSYDMDGITADHRIMLWQFSTSAENSPPVSLSWTTYDGYFTITNTGGTTSESIQPIFAIPNTKAVTTHTF